LIHSIALHDFQSHPDSHLEFGSGVNAIVGSSDVGKTAVLRALRWVWENRPAGKAIIRHGASQASVRVVADNGDTQLTVERVRGKRINKYVVGEQEFPAPSRDVPAEVRAALGLTETNVQSQLAPHFLVLDAPGKIAAFFNKITKLGDAEQVSRLLSARVRTLSTEVEGSAKIVESLEHRLAAPDFALLETFESHLSQLSTAVEHLRQAQEFHRGVVSILQALQCLDAPLAQAKRLTALANEFYEQKQVFDGVRERCIADAEQYISLTHLTQKGVLIRETLKGEQVSGEPLRESAEVWRAVSNRLGERRKHQEQLAHLVWRIEHLGHALKEVRWQRNGILSARDELLPLLRVCPVCGSECKDDVQRQRVLDSLRSK